MRARARIVTDALWGSGCAPTHGGALLGELLADSGRDVKYIRRRPLRRPPPASARRLRAAGMEWGITLEKGRWRLALHLEPLEPSGCDGVREAELCIWPGARGWSRLRDHTGWRARTTAHAALDELLPLGVERVLSALSLRAEGHAGGRAWSARVERLVAIREPLEGLLAHDACHGGRAGQRRARGAREGRTLE